MINKKGFTMVELLATIVLVGILSVIAISSVNGIIGKTKNEKSTQEKNTAIMAAKSYIQINKERAPKLNGEIVKITFAELKDAKYLTEDIVNSKGASCMNNSYVEIEKVRDDNYKYSAHIYCGGEMPPGDVDSDEPVLKSEIVFSNLNNPNISSFSFTIAGSESDEDIGISSYSYIIYTKQIGQSDYMEAYNSGPKSGKNNYSILVNETISDYVNLSGATAIKLTVIVRNEIGEELIQSKESTI